MVKRSLQEGIKPYVSETQHLLKEAGHVVIETALAPVRLVTLVGDSMGAADIANPLHRYTPQEVQAEGYRRMRQVEKELPGVAMDVGSLALGWGLGKTVTAFGFFGRVSKTEALVTEAYDRLQLEKLRTQYRQKASWVNPTEIQHERLRKIVDRLYRPDAKIGSGSTADALRVEIAKPGIKVGGSQHGQKTKEAIGVLERLLKNENLSAHERMVAENVRLDLLDAIGEKLWYSQTNTPKF